MKTDQEINEAIALKCGWIYPNPPSSAGFMHTKHNPALRYPPNYCSDLNAMHEAEKIIERLADSYMAHLKKATSCSGPLVWKEYQTATATARQRAEAFCRTVGIPIY